MSPDTMNSFMVEVDENDVIELAAWFSKDFSFERMPVKRLGKPNLLLGRFNCTLRLDILSADGVGISFQRSCRHIPENLAEGSVMIYMKLSSPLDSLGDHLSFFLVCRVAAIRMTDETVFLRLRILYEGVPDSVEKALNFVNVEKYGISDLTRWCDEKDRKNRFGLRTQQTGLRLDRLLAEIAAATSAKMPPAPTGHSG